MEDKFVEILVKNRNSIVSKEIIYKYIDSSGNDYLKNQAYADDALKSAFKRIKKYFDYDTVGGAPFLGLKGLVVKAHGSSDAKVFEFTIKQAEQFVNNKTVDKLIEAFEKTDK